VERQRHARVAASRSRLAPGGRAADAELWLRFERLWPSLKRGGAGPLRRTLNQKDFMSSGCAMRDLKMRRRATVSRRQLMRETNDAPPMSPARMESSNPEASRSLSESAVMSETLTVVILGLGRLPSCSDLAAWKLVRCVQRHDSSDVYAHLRDAAQAQRSQRCQSQPSYGTSIRRAGRPPSRRYPCRCELPSRLEDQDLRVPSGDVDPES